MSQRYQQILALLAEQPGDAFLLFAKAQEERKAGQLDDAVASFEQLRAAHPDYVGLYYHLAALYGELEASDRADETYRAGIEVALRQNDRHALAELKNAYVNWQLEQPD